MGKVTVHLVDVSKRQEIRSFVQTVTMEHGDCIHLLFNNAGIIRRELFDCMEEETFDKVMAVNLDGVVIMTREFWPLLVRAQEAVVVNTSSVAGFYPPAGRNSIPYVTSKYAVRGFSEALAFECKTIAPHVNVCVVHPGMISTQIVKNTSANVTVLDERVRKRAARCMGPRFHSLTPEDQTRQICMLAHKIFDRYGYTSKEAANMIVDGVRAGKLRIRVGWDAVFVDWWVRAFPTFFLYDPFVAVVGLTSFLGRHVYKPLSLFLLLAWLLRRLILRRKRL